MDKTDQLTLNLKETLNLLASKDTDSRRKARELLVILDKPAVSSLTIALQNSKDDHFRWEAAKTLGEINDPRSIPSFVKALEDSNLDVAWLAAETLGKFKMAAWPALLRMLIKRKPDSVLLRQGAHRVFLNQEEDGFNDFLESLRTSLKPNGDHELTVITANEILKRIMTKF
jgi:HEAT repeat protein